MVTDLRMNGTDAAFRTPGRASPAQTAVAWVMGGLAMSGALVLGSILALVFAATLAFVLVLAAAVLTFVTVAWRIRRPPVAHAGPVIEARKVGHSWVAYGLDQQP